MTQSRTTPLAAGIALLCALTSTCDFLVAQDPAAQDPTAQAPSYDELKSQGAQRSSYRAQVAKPAPEAAPEPDLLTFRSKIEPVLSRTCYQCHGPDKQKGDLRLDTLDPDLFGGEDVDWWLEVLGTLTNGEMPPEDEAELADDDRRLVIDWLAEQSQLASTVRRATAKHSSFRRMTRYEYNYALQDLLGVTYDFAEDLPPDPSSEDGFQNSSEVLHLTGIQFRAYLAASRKALEIATVTGAQPAPLFWSASIQKAAALEWPKHEQQLAKLRKKHKDDPDKLTAERKKQTARQFQRPRGTHFHDRKTGRKAKQSWHYNGAKFAWLPTDKEANSPVLGECVAVLPPRQALIVELGDRIPEQGMLRVRVRASRASATQPPPSMQLVFGWQASNDSRANVTISQQELIVDAAPAKPQVYEWLVPLRQVYPRNLMRKRSKMGDLPSPSELIKIVHASRGGKDLLVYHVDVAAPVYAQWPPASHRRVFTKSEHEDDEPAYAREVLGNLMPRAWRREVTSPELDRKMKLFARLRPQCDNFREAMIEVLATVLASPNFLYVVSSSATESKSPLADQELATRLSMFLWCSTPDEELTRVAQVGQLRDALVFDRQVQRMLQNEKAHRFSRQFVRQWLGLQLLDYLEVDKKAYPRFDASLLAAMREEPVQFFHGLLQDNLSVLEFLHSDFTFANERLAGHYGIDGVRGNHFRKVALQPEQRRGGLLPQAGLLAMNSDGLDSHPLKRGIWMLERLLNDPPPPPPPAVPEIDLADPEIAKMTLKERIEDHRNHAACMSCHAKIDPWGIAFENFDAVGSWRTQAKGRPVDSIGVLFNKQKLDGMDGLKRFLLTNRQDQFVRALAYKLTTFALGRPLTFADRAAIDKITTETRKRGDGLATMIAQIATSPLFQAK